MIENKINNLRASLRNMHMSEDDKRDVFKRINLVIDKIEVVSSEYHQAPVLSPFANKFFGKGFTSELFVYIKQRKFVPSLIAVFVLMVTGGFSALAENALPGDSLYSLKINVNEHVKGMVAITPEAKARLAVESTERRLQEAIVLSSQGKLTDDKKQILKVQLDKNASNVKTNVASLVASNDISIAKDVSINFEASLKTHELILSTISNATTTESIATELTSTSSMTSLMQDLRQEINLNAQVKDNLIQKETLEITDKFKLAEKIKETKVKYSDLLEQRKGLLNVTQTSDKLLESNLNIASTTIKEAEKALLTKDLTKTVSELQKSTRAISEAEALVSLEKKLLPEAKKVMELIDINKLINNSNATSTGAVLGTTTVEVIDGNDTSATSTTVLK